MSCSMEHPVDWDISDKRYCLIRTLWPGLTLFNLASPRVSSLPCTLSINPDGMDRKCPGREVE